MAVVNLDTCYLLLRDSPSQFITLDVSSLSDEESVNGDVRTYANGRVRAVSRAGRNRSISIDFDVVRARTTLALLKSWTGRTVLFRDPYGIKVWGVFYGSSVTENVLTDMAEVSLTLTGITVDEAV